MSHGLDLVATFGSLLMTAGAGTSMRKRGIQPEQPLELYEFENCPFCRKVRWTLTELDLEALIYPCPQDGSRFREKAASLAGRSQFPFLVDPNTGTQLLESDDIVRYLHERYGEGQGAGLSRVGPVATTLSGLGSLPRVGRGSKARASREPDQPLELYSFESSPFSRPVRELMCELELPYLLHNVGKASLSDFLRPSMRSGQMERFPVKGESRRKLLERGGKLQVPYLVDPNTGFDGYESADLIKYLTSEYALTA